jgi:Flp pilus assembly protein TadB
VDNISNCTVGINFGHGGKLGLRQTLSQTLIIITFAVVVVVELVVVVAVIVVITLAVVVITLIVRIGVSVTRYERTVFAEVTLKNVISEMIRNSNTNDRPHA